MGLGRYEEKSIYKRRLDGRKSVVVATLLAKLKMAVATNQVPYVPIMLANISTFHVMQRRKNEFARLDAIE